MREDKWFISVLIFLVYSIGIFFDILFLRPIILPEVVAVLSLLLCFSSTIVVGDICRNDASALNEYLRLLNYEKAEYKILYWGGLIAILPIGIFTLYYPSLSFDSQPSGIATITVASTVAQILATIFAITISVTLLSLEYFSQHLSSRIVQSFLKPRFIFIIVGSYLFMIPLLLYSTSLLDISSSTRVALVAIVWGLVCLTAYVVFIYDKIDPISQIKVVKDQVPNDFDSKILEKVKEERISVEDPFDRFIDVSNITRRVLQEGDIFVFSQWMSFFFDMENSYISERYQLYESGNASRDTVYDEITDIVTYFSFINGIILSEIKSVNDERFFLPYLRLLADRYKYAIEIKHDSKIKSLGSEFIDVLEYCIKSDERIKRYRNVLESTMRTYIESNIKMGQHRARYSDTSNSENWQVVWTIYFEELFRKVGKMLVRLSEDEMSSGNSDIALFMSQTLDSFIKTVIKTEGNIDLRKDLLQRIVYIYSQIYLIADEHDIVFLYINLGHIGLGESFNDNQVGLLLHIIDEYEVFVLRCIRQGDQRMVRHMGRTYVNLFENYPKVINRIMETLFQAVEADSSDSYPLLQSIDIVLDEKGSILRDDIKVEAEAILYMNEY